MIEWFTLNYPKFLGFITELTNVIFTLLKTLFNTIFIPIILIGVILVEVPRVQSGIMIFDQNETHALNGAWVLVLALLVLQLLVLYIEQIGGYSQEVTYRFSLRTFWQRIKYFLGYSRDFQPRAKSPAQKYKSVASLVKFGIIILSVIGTMQFVIVEASRNGTPWYEALVNIIYLSDLQTITNWLVGLVFALMIVNTSTALSNYIGIVAYDAYKEIQERQSVLIKKQKEKLTPNDFFEVFRSKRIKSLNYDLTDYFLYNDNKARFFDGLKQKLSEEFNIPDDRLRFINYVEKIINDRNSNSA